MSNERDELATTIASTLDRLFLSREYHQPAKQDYTVADAILTAGYRKPAVVTNDAELHDAIRRSFEDGESLVLLDGWRPWVIWEDADGFEHVSSIPVEDDPETLSLSDITFPVHILHPGAKS
ncbi:MAG: hypothetical protein ACTHJM_15740 [Marmoricola sp.]